MRTFDGRIAMVLSLLGAASYVALGWGTETVFDYHGRLAGSLVEGRWWLSEAQPHLNELVACGTGRWCVAYPPLPAVLSIPLLPLGAALAQSLMARVAGGASAGLLFLGLRAFGAPRWVAAVGTLVSAFGTTLLFSSVDGRSWYAAHSVAMLFGSAAFWMAARGGPSWAIGTMIGLATLARLPFAAAAPALALLASRRAGSRYAPVLAGVVLGGLPLAIAYLGYNILRWGSVFDLGYVVLTEGDVFFSRGLFSPLYVPQHLYAIFLETPEFVDGTPWFVQPRSIGMSLFLTTPVFLWVFAGLREVRRSRAVAPTAIAAGLVLLPNILHGTVGFQQFGYRFSIDAQPFLVALAVAPDTVVGGIWRRRPSVLFLVAALAAIVINVYAAIALVRFGFWR